MKEIARIVSSQQLRNVFLAIGLALTISMCSDQGGTNQAAGILEPAIVLQPLGGLDLNGYCQSPGFAGVTLTKPQMGDNAAFNNWRCVTADGNQHPFSMEQACKWQYGLNAVQAHPTDKDDAFAWACYSVGN